MLISLIVAASENDVIGKNNTLPWHLPDDLKFFRETTKGRTVIMGRKTYESIGKPLPNRRNIVISTTVKSVPGCEVFPTLGDALMKLKDEKVTDEIFVIGGARLFQEALMEIMEELRVKKIYLTRVHAEIDGDIKLPDISWKHWSKTSSKEHEKDKAHTYAFTFETYEHKPV